ncbi:hypothetical protein RR46_06396 [Papilio xuthus]|uniref:Uncharacterized protein n=1 Tax=Papilio xuthus TaxID=66420 RepID=A0A194QE68_PAPXU|nr:hypothetical protein RR46_06396 [Papilio xuthus]
MLKNNSSFSPTGLLPEALRTKCVRCTERQKRTAVKIIKRLKSEYPDEWAKLASKWDPTGDFTRYFEVFLANEQFNTISGNSDNPSSPQPSAQPVPQPNLLSVLSTGSSTSRPLTNPTTILPSPQQPQKPTISTPPRPLLLNRFADDGELMISSPSSAVATPRTTVPPINSRSPTTMRTRPTPVDWAAVGFDTMPTVFTYRPIDNNEAYTTAITFIDQIGNKIIRTTEFVADILKNTVRAVVG